VRQGAAAFLVLAAAVSAGVDSVEMWAADPQGPALQAGKTQTIKFVDVAAEAGLDLLNVSGGPAKDYIVDANGNGPGCSTMTTTAISTCCSSTAPLASSSPGAAT
jgi:hypothetical protein